MTEPSRSIVYVCMGCATRQEPTAPRSCLHCRKAMCEHMWAEDCSHHEEARVYGIRLTLTTGVTRTRLGCVNCLPGGNRKAR